MFTRLLGALTFPCTTQHQTQPHHNPTRRVTTETRLCHSIQPQHWCKPSVVLPAAATSLRRGRAERFCRGLCFQGKRASGTPSPHPFCLRGRHVGLGGGTVLRPERQSAVRNAKDPLPLPGSAEERNDQLHDSTTVLRRHSLVPLAKHYIQLSFPSSSPAVFFYSGQQLGCKSTGTSSSEQNEASLAPGSSKTDSNEVDQKLLETLAVSPAEQQRQAGMGHLKMEKVVDSFLNMGFSSAQIMQLFNLQPTLPPQPRLTVVSELLLLGLSTDSTLKALQKSPEMLKMSAKHLKDRADFLRRLGFKEDNLNHVAIHCPSLFTLPQKRIQAIERLLREKCLFTTQQVSKLLQTCPNILLEELDDIEYKFQFAYFRMGIKHREMVKAGFFQASLTEIKNRFVFLERLGLYQIPDKKGQTQVVNTKLKSIIRASESDFVTKIACSSVEEYEIFKKLLAREVEERWKQEVLKSELLSVDSDGEDSDTELGH